MARVPCSLNQDNKVPEENVKINNRNTNTYTYTKLLKCMYDWYVTIDNYFQ